MISIILRVLGGGLALILAAYIANASFWSSYRAEPVLLAHRGMAQTYHREGLERDTCTATRIDEPDHPFLENTIASMRAAFAMGADIVELDIHPTTDGQFAVFHDWSLECRTEGKGVTREQAMSYLKTLDVGYGYTADGGKTFPFRGTGVGLMPTLDEVLQAFPDKRFLINVKSRDPSRGRTPGSTPPATDRKPARDFCQSMAVTNPSWSCGSASRASSRCRSSL
jgi:glycerophosphoryl diester phosphodiesterase